MRIWLLTTEIAQEQAGGIARYVDTFTRLAGAAGHDVTIVARTELPQATELAPGVRLLGVQSRSIDYPPIENPEAHASYPSNVIGFWPGLSYQIADTVIELLKTQPAPDVIESQEYAALPYYLLQRKLTERGQLEQIPVLVHLHTPQFEVMRVNQEPRYRFPEYWIGQMEKFCIRAADALISPSEFLAGHIRHEVGHGLQIETIPYPMLPPMTHSAPEPTRGELVHVGRLEVRKGILPLLEACARLWDAGAGFRLTLIGGDTDFRPRGTTMGEHLRQRYSRWLDAGLLRMPGRMSQPEVLAHLRGAWATLVPSLWENFPNTCIEAMSVGQVVLASRQGGQAEMIAEDGVNGFLFDWNQPGEFEQKLQQVLDLPSAERAAVGARAQQRIGQLCDSQRVLAQRISHFEHMIECRSSRRIFPSMLVGQPPALPPTLPLGDIPHMLSVVVPFYNLGGYIEETVASVLAATYRPVEIVIVDDGSDDPESLKKLEALRSRHAEVHVVRIGNAGLANARNVGAEAARGEYVSFLDADDLVEPDYYTRAIDVLRRYENVAFVYSWVRWFESTNQIWPTWNVEFPYLLGHNMLAVFAVMPRARFLQAARNKPQLTYNLEDFEGWLSLAEGGGVGVSLPYPLVRYRIRPGSLYRRSQRDQQMYLFDLITQLHPESYQHWGAELFNLQNANGPARLWSNPALATDTPEEAVVALQAELQPFRDAQARGVWTTDMLRGGRLVAWLRRSQGVQVLRRLGAFRAARAVKKLIRPDR